MAGVGQFRYGALALCILAGLLGFSSPVAAVAPGASVASAGLGELRGTPSASSPFAERAFDGDHATTWTADGVGTSWISLDLGAEFSVTGVRPTFADSRLWSFVIEGSTDNQTWLPLADRQTGVVGNHFALDVSGRYRHVRLRTTAPVSVRELVITGTSEADLALGRTAFASTALPGYAAGNAVDGDSSTYWVAGNSNQSQWLTIDLGEPRPFTSVEQHFKDSDWVNFTIRGSNDNVGWTELARHTPPAHEPRIVRGQEFRFPVTATYRYVQLNVTATEQGHWVGSVAFRIMGPASGSLERDLALGVSAKSSSLIDNQTPAKAVDGLASTAWVADHSDEWQAQNPGRPQWLLVDLGNKASVSRIEQTFPDSSDWAFTIEASADASSWTTITSGPHQGRTFSYPVDGTYRYFKLTVAGKSSGNHWPASESFKIFGNGSPVTTRWWMDHGPVMRYYPKHYRQTLNSITAGFDDLKRKGYQAIELAAPYAGPWAPWAGLGATDNYAIDPSIGTMADFENLLAVAKAKGIKVVMFGNLGYSSPEAPFFKKAEADPNSKERKWFDFMPAPNGSTDCVNGNGWYYSATARSCYWVRWSAPGPDGQVAHMPAYNFATKEWQTEAAKVLRFWMDKGLDGFGADAPRAYRNITPAISDRYITDVLNSYDVWSLPEGLQPNENDPGDLLTGVPEQHYNVIHDLFINHWGCPGGRCSKIIPAIDTQNPSALENLFKASRDAINQQGGITLTMPSWELDLTNDQVDPSKRVPADKRLLEIATLTTMGSQFMLHYGNHFYLPHESTIPTWSASEQERLYQTLRAQTNSAALQPRGLRVKLHTNDDNKYYAYKRTSRNGGATALVVMNYQNSEQQITVDLANLGISPDQTPVNALTGQPAQPITGTSYTLTLPARGFTVLDVLPASQRTMLADGTYRVSAEVSGPDSALDVTDCQAQDGADVRIWNWIPTSPCQHWKVTKVAEPDVYTIADGNTGKVLDVAGCSSADTTIVHLWPYAARPCQQWRINPLGDNAWQVIGVGSGKSLDVAGCNPNPGADLIIWPYHAGSCQRWHFTP